MIQKTLANGARALAIAAWFATAAAPADVSIDNPVALNTFLDGLVERGDYPFLYARVVSFEGRVLYEYRTVNEELLPQARIDGQTWLRIWSMTKLVTISIVMDLVEEGRIDLDDPVTDYLPELANLTVARGPDGIALTGLEDPADGCPLQTEPVTQPMTVRHLMNHEAGFHYAVTGIECLDRLSAAQDLVSARDSEEFLERLVELPLVQQPGDGYYYGLSTTVLGMVAEVAGRRSLAELVERRLTGPLRIRGLQYTLPDGVELLPRFSGSDGNLRRANEGELDIFGGRVPEYNRRTRLFLGGEGMLATATGYVDFLRMIGNGGILRGHRVLEPGTIAEMTAPHTLLDNPDGHNGYNLWVSSGNGRTKPGGLWIGGGYEGTHFWIDPEHRFVAVVMTQVHASTDMTGEREHGFREALYAQIEP